MRLSAPQCKVKPNNRSHVDLEEISAPVSERHTGTAFRKFCVESGEGNKVRRFFFFLQRPLGGRKITISGLGLANKLNSRPPEKGAACERFSQAFSVASESPAFHGHNDKFERRRLHAAPSGGSYLSFAYY